MLRSRPSACGQVLSRRLDAACAARPPLVVKRPTDPWPSETDGGEANDIFASLEGWHHAGMVESRQMWCRFSQTVWFFRGDDTGGTRDEHRTRPHACTRA